MLTKLHVTDEEEELHADTDPVVEMFVNLCPLNECRTCFFLKVFLFSGVWLLVLKHDLG